jgi:hypothetical protein
MRQYEENPYPRWTINPLSVLERPKPSGERLVLRGMSFVAEPGKLTALVSPSGVRWQSNAFRRHSRADSLKWVMGSTRNIGIIFVFFSAFGRALARPKEVTVLVLGEWNTLMA